MLSVPLTLSNATAARLQEAVDYYNLRTGRALTPKAWIVMTLRQGILAAKTGEFKKGQAVDERAFKEALEAELDID